MLREYQEKDGWLDYKVSKNNFDTKSYMYRDPHQMTTFKGDTQSAAESGLPPHKQFNRINSFTLTGNSSLHFELSRDPTELIGAIFWQLKRIKIEKYDPVTIHSVHHH